MFGRSRRLTTRNWLIIVAVIASFLGACRWADKGRVVILQKRLERTQQFYDEGRVTIDFLIERSRDLLQAQLALGGDRADRIALIEAHLKRVDQMIKIERKQMELEFSCRGGRADIAEAEQMREEDAKLLAHERGESTPGQ